MDTTKSNRSSLRVILAGLLITGIIVYMAIPKKWEDATKTRDDGTITLSDDWAGTIEKKKERYNSYQLYELTAAKDSYFLCAHCPTGKFFLTALEIYRFGVTANGQSGRGYSKSWLAKNALNYNIIIPSADLTTVKTEETILIGSYATHPENLKRPISGTEKAKPYWYRLVLPPGNKSLE